MSQQSLLGKQIGEYKLEILLGEGGMASVYRALDSRLNRYVAIKVIRASFRADDEFKLRFEREAQAIAQLDHPNIITIYRYDELDTMLYMVMQYVDGADLSDVIASYHDDNAFVEFDEIIKLSHQIGSALDYAHTKGVIHRDIKPQNILIRQDGFAILSDFGLALLTEIGTRGEIFGSPHYIAPEQAISSAGAVPQSDLYAWAVILYEMLTGTLPFDAEQVLDVAMKHMTDEPPPPRSIRPELTQDVEDVLLKALSKDPQNRYQTGKELAQALETALKATPDTHLSSPRHKQQTIPQRVALQVEANPLPPLPSPVAQSAKSEETITPLAEPATQKSSPQSSQRSTIGAIVAVVVVILGVALLLSRNSPNDSASSVAMLTQAIETVDNTNDEPTLEAVNVNPTAETNIEPTNTAVPIVVPPTHTVMPTDVPPTNSPQPVVEPTQVPTAQTWTITIQVEKDTIFVVNDSTIGFPLASLVLVGEGSVTGMEWGIDELLPGQCVATWKDKKKADKYKEEDSDCQLVGETLTRKKKERFWESEFDITYQEQYIGLCPGEKGACVITLTQ
jgi:serine/threonine protein kinase